MSGALEVWLDADWGPTALVGTLAHDRGQVRFQYSPGWLSDARAFAIDPDLSLDRSPFFPKPDQGNFGIFLDSSPDRWGQTLMKRREALQAKDDKRPAPPIASLRELEEVAFQLSSRRLDDRDAGAWEFLAHTLAQAAGITVPPAKLLKLNSDFHTFCVQRFDRKGQRRRFYASAMTMLRKDQSEGSSYLELAQFLRQAGDPAHVEADLAQLFSRVLFNVAIGNRDDHLRNHGFILEPGGWRLAPAFDVNPNVDKADHVLNLDDQDNRPDLGTVLSTASFYGVSAPQAEQLARHITHVVSGWQASATRLGISQADIDLTATAFAASAP